MDAFLYSDVDPSVHVIGAACHVKPLSVACAEVRHDPGVPSNWDLSHSS